MLMMLDAELNLNSETHKGKTLTNERSART